jgi:hypothetical protein
LTHDGLAGFREGLASARSLRLRDAAATATLGVYL